MPLSTLTNLVWMLPPITQRKGRYKTFFFILGLAGCIQIICSLQPLRMLQSPVAAITLSMLFLSFSELRLTLMARVLLLFCITAAFITFQLYHYYYGSVGILILLLALVLLLVLRRLITEGIRQRAINLFTVALIIYQLSVLLRFFNALTHSSIGLSYYKLSLYLEVALALFFTFFRETNSRLIIKLRV